MKYGFVMPSGNARDAADLAHEAEHAGWDGFFVCEPVWGTDAWVALTAAAMRTERIKLGTMLSPISRMKPWKLASESVTLDDLSGGRVIVAVGLGAPSAGYYAFGEQTDRKLRAELMDEGLAILTGLWRGQPFAFHGNHYHVEPFDLIVAPPPVQLPRIPIWLVGSHGKPKTLVRAAKYDGLVPSGFNEHRTARQATPTELNEMLAFIVGRRTLTTPFDAVVEGVTPGDDRAAAEIVQPFREAGATWWLEADWSLSGSEIQAQLVRRLRQGPPSR